MDIGVLVVESMVRGYHVYKDVWSAAVGQRLPCKQERGNPHDPYAIAVTEGSVIVGHVPREISAVCSLFLQRTGTTLLCEVTGGKRYSADLPQGGLEIPCRFIFSGPNVAINKVEKLLQCAPSSGLNKWCKHCKKDSLEERPAKKIKLEMEEKVEGRSSLDEAKWMDLDGIQLLQSDKRLLHVGRLNDKHINFAQCLLKKQFPCLEGLMLTILQTKVKKKIVCGLQIIHSRNNHWIVASTLGCEVDEIKVFDSLYTSIDEATKHVILGLSQHTHKILMEKMQIQEGFDDCGLFAIAVATALALDGSTSGFQQTKMRDHAIKCFEEKVMKPFPCNNF